MRCLISAFECAPNRGSEAGVGWNWSLQIAKQGIEVDVVTATRNRQLIEAARSQYQDLPISFYYLGPSALLAGRLNHWALQYYAWQFSLIRLARRLHKKRRYDIAHHLTYCNDWTPSGLSWLDVPFIWGPVGGSTHGVPTTFSPLLNQAQRRSERFRSITQTILKRFDPFLRKTLRNADQIVCYSFEALEGIPARYQSKACSQIHIGVDSADLPTGYRLQRERYMGGQGSKPGPLRLLTGGRLVHWKGFDLAIEALLRHRERSGLDSKLLVSSVPNSTSHGEAHIKDLIRRYDAGAAVEIIGELSSRDEVYEFMVNCDLYVLPTWRDGPPTAILEAMHAGLPVLTLDLGAPAELLPDSAGFKVGVMGREAIVSEMTTVFDQIALDREVLLKMGDVGREYALASYSWDRIGQDINDLYLKVITHGGSSKASKLPL